MTLFRCLTNQKLYTIAKVTPRMVLGTWYEAIPYNHNIPVFSRKWQLTENDLGQFVAIAQI